MVGDLKFQERMNRCKRFFISRCDPDSSTTRNLLKPIAHLPLQALKSSNTWRCLIVDEHWVPKVASGKHDGYVREMQTDLVLGLGVFQIVGDYHDCPAIRVQPEMVRCLLVGESYYVIATHINCGVIMILGRKPRRPEGQAQEAQDSIAFMSVCRLRKVEESTIRVDGQAGQSE